MEVVPYQGGKINEFSGATVDAEVLGLSVDFSLNTYWDSQPLATYCNNLIFEYDALPTGLQTKNWNYIDGTPLNLRYRSGTLTIRWTLF